MQQTIVRLNLTLLLAVQLSFAAQAAGQAPIVTPTFDPKAQAVLLNCVSFFQGLDSIEVDCAITETTNSPKGSAALKELAYSFHLAIKQPNSLAVETNSKMWPSAYYDGKTLTYYDAGRNQFRTQDAPQAVKGPVSLADNLTTSIGVAPSCILASLLKDSALGFLSEGFVKMSTYCGIEKFENVMCDHIRLRTADFPGTVELWVANGRKPLIMKSVANFDEGKSEHPLLPMGLADTTRYSNWKINEPISDDMFVFHPPYGATLTPSKH